MKDQPVTERPGEEIDRAKLKSYLREVLEGPADELRVEQFPGGHSNLTYAVHYGDKEYVLRRPPMGTTAQSAHDMGREYRVLSKLWSAWDKAPRPILYCEDAAILGAPFYLMERLEGLILRKSVPAGLELRPSLAERLSLAVVDTLVELHSIDVARAGLEDLGRPEGYVERQVIGWSKRYTAAQTDELPVVGKVASWLAANQPRPTAAALIHNDFKLDNMVLDAKDPGQVVGVLDWEMCTLGDPMMDLGTTLGYWVQADDPQAMLDLQLGLTHLPGMLSRQALVQRYAAGTGRAIDEVVFYYAFGLFKTAVIAQQIYYRFHTGMTTDPRFAAFLGAVSTLCEQAQRSIERGRL